MCDILLIVGSCARFHIAFIDRTCESYPSTLTNADHGGIGLNQPGTEVGYVNAILNVDQPLTSRPTFWLS